MAKSKNRAESFESVRSPVPASGSRFSIIPAMFSRNASGASSGRRRIPDRPEIRPSQVASMSRPRHVTAPWPTTKIRWSIISSYKGRLDRGGQVTAPKPTGYPAGPARGRCEPSVMSSSMLTHREGRRMRLIKFSSGGMPQPAHRNWYRSSRRFPPSRRRHRPDLDQQHRNAVQFGRPVKFMSG